MSELPKYLIRPEDYMVFSLNDDGWTYTIDQSKKDWPDRIHHEYMYETLIKAKFTPATDNTLYLYNEPREEYYKKQIPKYDGHGD
jgi:hypothetical protein